MFKKHAIKETLGALGQGPGSYNITPATKHSYSYSMGNKLEDIHAKAALIQPGPGQYNTLEYTESGPKSRFGTANRTRIEGNKAALYNEPSPS